MAPSYSSLRRGVLPRERLDRFAAVLGLSTERVRQLDDVLEPMRTARGQRIYRREIVERYASERAAAKAKKLSTSTTG